ncbi:MAG: peptidase M16 [Candidatus Puniceispirillum sp.]|nr:peptidase M16 [Candidatus Puniceispirillum sp.]
MTTRITTLSSGLRVVTDQIDTVETAAVGMWVGVGARHEASHEAGVSHFLEHMAFKGTANRSAQDIAETIEGVGGHLNAYTSRETTCYYARVLGDDVPLAVDLLSDILQFSTFREEELIKERDVILQEIGEALDNPDDIVFDQLQRTAYANQALGASILGTVESVSTMARATLQAYQDAHYKAPSMVLAAAGKVRHEALVALVEEKFQHLSSSLDTSFEKATFSGGALHLHRPLEQVHLMVGYEGLRLGHPRFYTQSVLAAVLGGGMSSRLFQEIREKRALAYSVYGFTTAYSDAGLMGFSMGTSEKSVQNALDVLRDELNKVHTSLQPREIARVKAQLKASLMMALESTSSRCEQLAQQLLIYGRPVSAAEIIDRIESVTLEDVADLAKEMFAKEGVISTVGPLTAPVSFKACA